MASKIKQFCIDHLVSILLVAIAITLALSAVGAWAKYTETLSSTTNIKLSIVDYTIDKNKMWKVMQGLDTKPTTVKFVKGTEVPTGLTNLATTTATGNSVAGIQQDDASMIGVFQSTDGTTLYIAPMNAPADGDTTGAAATAASNEFVMHTPTNAKYFMCDAIGSATYTSLGNTLETLDLGNLDASRSTDLAGAFERLPKLTTVENFGNFAKTTSNVTSFTDLFYADYALTSLDVSNLNTSSATSLSCMFQSCTSLKTLTGLTSFNTENVQYMSRMFESCSALTSLDLSSFNTQSVTAMKDMFKSCSKLAEVTLSKDFKWKGTDGYLPTPSSSSITGATGSWYDTTSGDAYTPAALAGVTRTETRTYTAVPTYTIDKSKMQTQLRALAGSSTVPTAIKFVKGNDSAVSGLTNLYEAGIQDTNEKSAKIAIYQDGTTVYIAPADKNDSTSVMYAPKDCANFLCGLSQYTNLQDSLTTLEMSNLDTSKVTTMSSMFNRLSALTSIDVSGFDTKNVTNMDFMFYMDSALTSLNVGAGDTNSKFDTSNVTSMDGTFGELNVLSALDISNFNTAKVQKMSNMFINCYKLATLTFDTSKFATGNVTTMYRMFNGCNVLSSLDVSKFDTSNVTNMMCMFNACKVLTSLDVSDFNTSKVTDMSYMFNQCESLSEELNLKKFNTKKVTNMAYMFAECKALTKVDASSFDTGKVTRLDRMFQDSSALTEVDISSFKNSEALYNTSWMFAKCNNLATLKMSDDFNTSGVQYMDGMFTNCYELGSLNVSGFKTPNVKTFTRMFDGCQNVTSLDLSGFDTSGTTSATSAMFNNCIRLSSVKLGSNFNFSTPTSISNLPTPDSYYITNATGKWKDTVTSKTYTPADLATFHNGLNQTREYVADTGVPYNLNKDKMHTALNSLSDADSITALNFVKGSEVPTGATCVSTATSGIQADNSGKIGIFQDGSTLYIAPMNEDSTTPKSTDSESVIYAPEDSSWLLSYKMKLDNLASVSCANLDTSNVTNMSDMFYGYADLTSLTFGDNFDTSSVTSMREMFGDNTGSNISLDVSKFDTSSVTDMNYMFGGFDNLTSLTFGDNFNTSSVTDMNSMFFHCSGFTSLDVSKFDTSSVTDMGDMFIGCSNLTSLDVSNFDTSSVTDMSRMFWLCSNLKTIYASDKFVTDQVSSSVWMFYDCPNLVGGAGTTYDSSKPDDKTYARIDGGTDNPGYFTAATQGTNAIATASVEEGSNNEAAAATENSANKTSTDASTDTSTTTTTDITSNQNDASATEGDSSTDSADSGSSDTQATTKAGKTTENTTEASGEGDTAADSKNTNVLLNTASEKSTSSNSSQTSTGTLTSSINGLFTSGYSKLASSSWFAALIYHWLVGAA